MLPTVTTVRRGPPPNKAFSWSWTKIKNYEMCPRRSYNVDVLKAYKDTSDALTHGNLVHKHLADRLSGTALPPERAEALEPWAKWIEDGDGLIQVECDLAITKDFTPCAWFDSDNRDGRKAWLRAKIDVIKVAGPVATIVDWKTGKLPRDGVDNMQLMLNAAVAFIHHPELWVIRSYFAWLQENHASKLELRKEQLPELWKTLWPRIETVREAYAKEDFPPRPCYLCEKFCPVKSCEYNGKKVITYT
jgi:hypothetical protein